MSANDISISFSDDHLAVALPDTQLTNGLDLATQNNMHSSVAADAIPLGLASTISATTTSLSMTTSNNQLATNHAAATNSRFQVQPTDAAVLQSYIRSQNTTVHSNTNYMTSSSTPEYQNSTAVQPTQPIRILTRKTNSDSNMGKVSAPHGVGVRRVNSDSTTPSRPQVAANGAPNSEMKKRVSFPDGQALIKGFAHAPNPWYNVSLCTTENLVSAYMNSCNSHSVRPLQKLMSQLNCIRDFGERINLLTLKGENMNHKHIESLEEIFRRVQFVTVDMESTHLDDESAIALFEMVEYYESVIHLKLSYNKNLGIRAWLSAARMIRKTPCLESLDIHGCSLNEQSIAALGRALRMGAFIHTLYIQECNLSCRGVMIISAALRTIPTIKELYIGDNNLQPSDGIQLGNLLRNNIHLHTLDIKGNHLQDIGIQHICDGLAEQPNGIGLKALNLTSNHFSHASMGVLANALARTRSLNTLNISSNNITNEGFFVLKEGLLKNKSLCRLSLRATKLSDEGAVALAEYIADSYTISQLDLRENDIKTAGLLAVSMCLRVHQTVTRLEIDQNVKKENAVKDYQSQQKFFLDEIQSQLSKNAEIQRAKLDKLLTQSKSELYSGSRSSSVSEPQNNTTANNTANNSAEASAKPAEASTVSAPPASQPQPKDPSQYFDPLGAVSIPEDSQAKPQAGDTQSTDNKVSDTPTINQLVANNHLNNARDSIQLTHKHNDVQKETIQQSFSDSSEVTPQPKAQCDSLAIAVSSVVTTVAAAPVIGAGADNLQINNNSVAEKAIDIKMDEAGDLMSEPSQSNTENNQAPEIHEAPEPTSDSSAENGLKTEDRSVPLESAQTDPMRTVGDSCDEKVESDLINSGIESESVDDKESSEPNTKVSTDQEENIVDLQVEVLPSHNVPTLQELALTVSPSAPVIQPTISEDNNVTPDHSESNGPEESFESERPASNSEEILEVETITSNDSCEDEKLSTEVKADISTDENAADEAAADINQSEVTRTEDETQKDLDITDQEIDSLAERSKKQEEAPPPSSESLADTDDERVIDAMADELVADAVKHAVDDIAEEIMENTDSSPDAAALADSDTEKPEIQDNIDDMITNTTNENETASESTELAAPEVPEITETLIEVGAGDAAVTIDTDKPIPSLKQLAEEACTS